MTVGRQFPLLDGVVPAGKPFFHRVGGVLYRYNLPRSVGDRGDGPRAVFVCMNPSSADEWHDDWTNRQIARRAVNMNWRGSELSGWNTVNLCGAIATNPRDLLQLTSNGKDPVGPHNLAEINKAAEEADLIVVAWGERGAPWASLTIPILRRWASRGTVIYHWGDLTKALKQPRHPSRLRRAAELRLDVRLARGETS
jgi:hypothetical protein